MPVVRAKREISHSPLPAVRRRFAATAESEGAGVEAAKINRGEAIAGMGGVIARFGAQRYAEIQAEERDAADRVAILEAENKLSAWENERLYHPEKGALTVKGKDSFTLPEELAGEYSSVTSEIETGLTTERQKEAFARLKSNRGQNLDLTIRRHVFGEMQAHTKQELASRVENGINAAVSNSNDPKRVGEELAGVTEAIRSNAKALGYGPEQLEQQIGKVQSAVHTGVIDRLLAQDRDKAAQVYFEETKGQISGEAQARIEKALEEGRLRGQSQQKADEIIAAGGTLTEQREKARNIDDPELRDQVMQRLEHESAVKERIERETEEARSIEAYNIIDKTGSLSKIPPGMWTSFSGAQRSAMRSYAEHKAKGIPVKTDWAAYYSAMQQAANDPQGFAQENLLNMRHKLDETEFKQLVGLQSEIKAGNLKTSNKELDNFRTNKQVIDDTLALYNINPNPKANTPESKTLAQLQRMLGQRMDALTALTGKSPTNKDVQESLDFLLGQSVETEGSFWNLWQKRSKRLVDLTYEDVPAADRPLIEEALRKKRKPVTPESVLDLYLETQARRPK